MKILVLDIETSPSLAYVWALWDQNVGLNQIVDAGEVICFAAKWLGEKSVEFRSNFHDGHEAMIQRAHELVDEADAIIHFNGKSFDIKHLNKEFLLAGLAPPSPHKDIDLLTVVRGRFKLLSNKLQYVAKALGLEGKAQTGGFELWVKCMANDEKAWKTMKKYNIQDVHETEKVYYRILPWIKSHPSVPLFDGDGEEITACPTCGSDHLQKRGFYHSSISKFQQYQCQDCGAWCRDGRRVEHVKVQSVS